MYSIPTFCPECGEIHKIVPSNLSYPSATVAVDGKETEMTTCIFCDEAPATHFSVWSDDPASDYSGPCCEECAGTDPVWYYREEL